MLEPGPDEAADLRIPDPHVRRLQHHHPEPVHGVTGLEPANTQEISELLCFDHNASKFKKRKKLLF